MLTSLKFQNLRFYPHSWTLQREFSFRENVSSATAVARQQKSSQMNANSIRCVTIAGVCKRQNGSPVGSFPSGKLFARKDTRRKFSCTDGKYISRNSYRIYKVSTMWLDAILVKRTSSAFSPDFRVVSSTCITTKLEKSVRNWRKIDRNRESWELLLGNYRNYWWQKLNSTQSTDEQWIYVKSRLT